jgi:hypothetical protein
MAAALLPFGSRLVPTLTLPCRAANSLLFNRRTPPVSLLTLLGTRADGAVFGFGTLIRNGLPGQSGYDGITGLFPGLTTPPHAPHGVCASQRTLN